MTEYRGFRIQAQKRWTPDRVDPSDMSPAEFYERYIQTRTPVILTSHPADAQWTASALWTPEYLSERAGDQVVQIETRQENDPAKQYFGSGRTRRLVLFRDFIEDVVMRGDTSIYLSTQYDEAEEGQDASREKYNSKCNAALEDVVDLTASEEDELDQSGQETDPIKDFQAFCPSPLPSLLQDFPLRPDLMGNLIPQQVNLWMGAGRLDGASSGLHHDFADNLYVVIKGKKRFTIFAPSDAHKLYMNGTISKIHPNGLIQYESRHATRSDGAFLEDVAQWKVQVAADALQRLENGEYDSDDTQDQIDDDQVNDEILSEVYEEDMIDRDGTLENESDEDEAEDVDENEEMDMEQNEKLTKLDVKIAHARQDLNDAITELMNCMTATEHCDEDYEDTDDEASEPDWTNASGGEESDEISDGSDIDMENLVDDYVDSDTENVDAERADKYREKDPDSFSKINPGELHSSHSSLEFPLLAQATRATFEVKEGEMLYLPASWFHEVVSLPMTQKSSSKNPTSTGLHMAFNYWFHPPSCDGTFDQPYIDNYWAYKWKEMMDGVKAVEEDEDEIPLSVRLKGMRPGVWMVRRKKDGVFIGEAKRATMPFRFCLHPK